MKGTSAGEEPGEDAGEGRRPPSLAVALASPEAGWWRRWRAGILARRILRDCPADGRPVRGLGMMRLSWEGGRGIGEREATSLRSSATLAWRFEDDMVERELLVLSDAVVCLWDGAVWMGGWRAPDRRPVLVVVGVRRSRDGEVPVSVAAMAVESGDGFLGWDATRTAGEDPDGERLRRRLGDLLEALPGCGIDGLLVGRRRRTAAGDGQVPVEVTRARGDAVGSSTRDVLALVRHAAGGAAPTSAWTWSGDGPAILASSWKEVAAWTKVDVDRTASAAIATSRRRRARIATRAWLRDGSVPAEVAGPVLAALNAEGD